MLSYRAFVVAVVGIKETRAHAALIFGNDTLRATLRNGYSFS